VIYIGMKILNIYNKLAKAERVSYLVNRIKSDNQCIIIRKNQKYSSAILLVLLSKQPDSGKNHCDRFRCQYSFQEGQLGLFKTENKFQQYNYFSSEQEFLSAR